MKKVELIKKLAEELDIPQGKAEDFVDRLGEILSAELLDGGEAPLPGIGKLKIKTRAARAARNPRTGAAVQVPARKVAVLAVGKELRDALV